MKLLVKIICLWVPWVTTVILAFPKKDLRVTVDSPECVLKNDTLMCDYENVTRPMVHLKESLNSSVQTVFIHNVETLHLSESVCVNLHLCNVSHIEVMTMKGQMCHCDLCTCEPCEGDIELSVKNSNLDRLPSTASNIYLEQCEVKFLSPSDILRNLTVISSLIKVLDATMSFSHETTALFYNSSVDTLQNLTIGPNSQLSFQKSLINFLDPRTIIVNEGNLIFQESSVNLTSDDNVLLMPKSSVTVEDFKRKLNVSVAGKKNIIMETLTQNISTELDPHEVYCNSANSYFIAFISFLTLFVIMTVLFLLQLLLKRQKKHHEEEKVNSCPDDAKRAETAEENSSHRPLLKDSTDRTLNMDELIDIFEDDLVKSVDITKALYLEDLEDIKSEMQAALEIHRKSEFDEFIKENGKRLELQEFQVKSKSKRDKNTAMLERMDQSVRELVEKHYLSCVFDLQNSGDDIKLKHKERVVECNKRFSEDLVEVMQTAMKKWSDELETDKISCPHVVQCFRTLLSSWQKSMKQLEVQTERYAIESKQKYNELMSDLGSLYTETLKAIKASAEKKSELVRSLEIKDITTFGNKKAFQLSNIKEEIISTTQALQQKEAEREFTEVRQKLLLQEELIHHQEYYMSQLERITAMITDTRKCYMQSIKQLMFEECENSKKDLCANNSSSTNEFSLTIIREEE